MEYDGCVIGPHLRELRKKRKLTLDEASEKTGLSISTLKQLEQGGRRLSLRSMYLLMEAYQCDANTLLAIERDFVVKQGIEQVLNEIPEKKCEEYLQVLEQIIEILEKQQFLGGVKSERKQKETCGMHCNIGRAL